MLNENTKKADVRDIKYFDVEDRKFCLGEDCPDKDCKICPANKSRGVLDVSDSYRDAVKNGYYTSTVTKYKDPITGKEKYCYTRSE